MKKIPFLLLEIAALVMSCENISENEVPQESSVAQEIDMSDFFVQTEETASKDADQCQSMSVLNRQLQENPGLYQKMYDIEYNTRKAIAMKGKPGGGNGGGDPEPTGPYVGLIEIPVVINILESYEGKVTDDQITTQIDILNEDFNNNNPNTSNTPGDFSGDVANVNITFTLAGVNRKISSKTKWGTRDTMKKSKRGGIDPTEPATHLNIWVCEIGGGILGYAQFPGGSSATDGVVIGTDYFGETSGVYGDGRTATHEVGHYLNLRHIWGDGGCSADDFVADTPTSDGANYGCPGYPDVSCSSADMTMNYMDYVYDDCMYMFTNGQNERMRTIFSPNGARETMVN